MHPAGDAELNPAPARISPWRLALGGMFAMAAAIGIGRFVYTPILPMMMAQESLSAGQAGMIASSNYLGYLIGAMIAATTMLRGSQRAWLLGALFASAVTTLYMAWTESYVGFLATRFIGGLVSAWVLVFATTLVITRLTDMGRGGLTAVLFAGVGLGIVFASLLTGLAMDNQDGWRGAWINSGAAALAATLLVAVLVPGRRTDAAAMPVRSENRGRSIGGLLAAYGLFGFGYVITATFIVQLVRSAAYPPEAEIAIWVLVGIAGIPSVWLWNRYAAVAGNSRAFSVACVVLAVGVGASVLMPGLWGLVPGAVLLGSTFMAITAIGLVEARERSGKDPRHALAMMTAAFGAGQIIGPAVAGYMRDAFGSFLLPSILASVLLVLAAALAHR